MMSLGTLLTIHRSHWSGKGQAKKLQWRPSFSDATGIVAVSAPLRERSPVSLKRDTGEPVVLDLMSDYEGRHPIFDCQIVDLIFSDHRP